MRYEIHTYFSGYRVRVNTEWCYIDLSPTWNNEKNCGVPVMIRISVFRLPADCLPIRIDVSWRTKLGLTFKITHKLINEWSPTDGLSSSYASFFDRYGLTGRVGAWIKPKSLLCRKRQTESGARGVWNGARQGKCPPLCSISLRGYSTWLPRHGYQEPLCHSIHDV